MQWNCVECDENYQLGQPKANSQHRCSVCGTILSKVVVPEVVTPQNIQNPVVHGISGTWDGLFDILGDEFREAVEQSMALAAPTRQISTKYLSTLGIVKVDSRHSILYDISIVAGPLTMLGVSASFGFLPADNAVYEKVADLYVGSTQLDSSDNVTSDSAVALSRGVISFEQKTNQVIAAGGSSLLVFQTYDKWPFIMTEDASSCTISSIPAIMVSKLHGELLTKMNTIAAKGNRLPQIKIKIGEKVTECSVCQENFAEGDEVLKLPCRHVYHCQCVTTWLQQNHTCPLCRLQLPKELPTTSSTSNSHINSDIYY